MYLYSERVFSYINRKYALYATTLINLENIMLIEKNKHKRSYISYDPIYMKYPEWIDPQREKVDSWH